MTNMGAYSITGEGMFNITTGTEFLLLGFSEVRELQLVHGMMFLLVYLAALMGNLLIVTVTALDERLHTPMYFFLSNLALIDLCLISVTVPKSVVNSLTNNRSISFLGCVLQVLFFISLASTEMILLTVMSHDRYTAICHPLRYEVVMNRGACGKMAAASWLSGGLSGLMHMATTFSEPFCGSHVIHHFFCEAPHLLAQAGSTVILREVKVTIFTASLSFLCFISIIISYIRIFSIVLKIPSVEGRSKAFSTCLPHLVVVILFLSAGAFAYLKSKSNGPSGVDLFLSMFYSIVPPAMNPIIYSLRNRELKLLKLSGSDWIMAEMDISALIAYLLVSVFYTGCPPTLNPLIYSLRNKEHEGCPEEGS
ncbi:olfactory receptor 14A16-like [Ornithorhynchus anatinus]|uniref:olfactory receptor 14A16-like n=1 Tax=Ornithorhynchus anatinus TaxID=9258 RepID=UPI0010A76C83|nr:olfactory receptor 14A16-like [Ornithorhynchus anatinus]